MIRCVYPTLCALVAGALLHPTPAQAQQEPPPPAADPQPDPGPDPQPDPTPAVQGEIQALSDRLSRTEAEAAEQKKRADALEEKVEELSQRLDKAQEDQLELAASNAQSLEQLIGIYGFFDLNLFYYQIDEDAPADAILPQQISFTLSRLHLYFTSQMTDTLSALAEIKFTFLPHGHETSYNLGALGLEYERVDTTVFDAFSAEEYPLGGIAIERVHLTWKPRDFFGVIAGRFLTPFGIWNVEHGSPVLIPVRTPYFMSRNLMPPAQTGLQLFGRLFPLSGFHLDYAVTVSNGRGPTEAIYDLDANKALGLKLKGAYDGNDLDVELGGYLYYGETTDVVKTISVADEISFDVETVENYTELTGSIDLLVKLYGIRIQSEYIRGLVEYDIRPPVKLPVIGIDDPVARLQPDYIKWSLYGLAGYEIAFDTSSGPMLLTPYFMVEYCQFDDTHRDYTTLAYRGGLNFKPSVQVTLKYETVRVTFPEGVVMSDPFWIHSGQLAVSF